MRRGGPFRRTPPNPIPSWPPPPATGPREYLYFPPPAEPREHQLRVVHMPPSYWASHNHPHDWVWMYRLAPWPVGEEQSDNQVCVWCDEKRPGKVDAGVAYVGRPVLQLLP